MDYTTLVSGKDTTGSIKFWLNYSRIDSEGILDEAEAWIFRELRVFEMLATDDVAIASGASTAAVPTGYLDPVHFAIPGWCNRVKFLDAERFRTELGWDQDAAIPEGTPMRWSYIDEQMNFDHKADRAYTGKMVFFKRPTALSSSNTTNWLTDKYPTLVRRACIMLGAEARKEFTLMDRHELTCRAMIKEIAKENDLKMRGMELDYNWQGSD